MTTCRSCSFKLSFVRAGRAALPCGVVRRRAAPQGDATQRNVPPPHPARKRLRGSVEDRVVRVEARLVDAVIGEVAVEVRRRQVDGPVDDVEDDERRREDDARETIDVLRRADPALGVRPAPADPAFGLEHLRVPDVAPRRRRRRVM